MIPSENVADRRRGFMESVRRGEIVLVHRVDDTARTGLESVANVRQSAAAITDMEYSRNERLTSLSILTGTIF
jgi:hypothetical protein